MNDIDTSIARKFGRNLAEIRIHKGYTQVELAYRCNMHRAYIGAIERGEKNINICTLHKLANGLNIEPYKLLLYASK